MPIPTSALHRFFQAISKEQDWAVMLGGAAEPTALNQWCIIGIGTRQTAILQSETLTVNGQTEALSNSDTLFERLEMLRKQAKSWPDQDGHLPLSGGLFGAFGYEFYRWCDPHWEKQTDLHRSEWPEAIFCEFEDWLILHLESAQLTVLSDSLEREACYHGEWRNALTANISPSPSLPAEAAYPQSFEASLSEQAFESAVERLKQDIRNGEIYQANLSLRLQKTVQLDPYVLFERLCHRNPSPFAGFFKWPGGVIVSNSPERLVQSNGQRAQTRPIAGTRGRGQTLTEDAHIGQTLLANDKERAEHLMLVDLARNDLGRLCVAGSVQVEDLLILERYSHVTHLVSNVQGQLKNETTPWGLLRSLFPGGTITGCPKLRCIEILNAVEPVPRGFYTGSFGYVDAKTGALDFNILIRSVFLRLAAVQPTKPPLVYNAAVHVGAGIVHDAVGAYEARECARKAAAILDELYTLETQPTGEATHEPNPDGCRHF